MLRFEYRNGENTKFVHKKPGDTLSFLVRYLMESIFLSRIITMKSFLFFHG